MTREQRIEYRAQQRASGKIVTGPDHPVIGSRPYQPGRIESAQDALNAKRMAAFHARWRGQQEPLIQLWEAS